MFLLTTVGALLGIGGCSSPPTSVQAGSSGSGGRPVECRHDLSPPGFLLADPQVSFVVAGGFSGETRVPKASYFTGSENDAAVAIDLEVDEVLRNAPDAVLSTGPVTIISSQSVVDRYNARFAAGDRILVGLIANTNGANTFMPTEEIALSSQGSATYVDPCQSGRQQFLASATADTCQHRLNLDPLSPAGC